MVTYTDAVNPYKEWHMRRAFRLGWETAEQGLDLKQAHASTGRTTEPADDRRVVERLQHHAQRAPHMEQMEVTTISNPGEPIKAALRSGTFVVIALRLGPGVWEPLYAINGKRPAALPTAST
jgi:hypothetical protein